MSSMRSASSRISISTRLSITFLLDVVQQTARRGHQHFHATAQRFFCGSIATPPNTTAERSGRYLLYCATLALTWSASSRVGVRISARTGCMAGEALLLACARRRDSSGRVKAAVLPVPVWAAASTSLPPNTTGMAFA